MNVTAGFTVLSSTDIEVLPWEPLGSLEGVKTKVAWRDDTSMAGLLRVEAGRSLGRHTHRVNHHHMWVLEGQAEVMGKDLGPGSYVHIPAGVEHDIDASRTEGCTVLYHYLRPAATNP